MTIASERLAIVDVTPFFDTHSHAAGFDTGTPVDDRGGKNLRFVEKS